MYPQTYFGLFPPFPRENKVFVAMSFAPQFQARWKAVITPAIRSVMVNGKPLEPHRVDARQISDSVLTEILGGITNDRLIFADVSTISYDGERPVRNANVMYEVGMAHAVRLPEEVLLFRSDSDELLFDLANVRVNEYNPDDAPDAAISLIKNAIMEVGKEVDLRQRLAVDEAVKKLDAVSWWILVQSGAEPVIRHPQAKTIREVPAAAERRTAICRLLELGLLRAEFLRMTPELVDNFVEEDSARFVTYRRTEFGRAVVYGVLEMMGAANPEVVTALGNWLSIDQGEQSAENGKDASSCLGE